MDKHELPEGSESVDDTALQRDNYRADPLLQASPPPPAAQVPPIPPIAVHINARLSAAIAQAITITMTAREQHRP